MNCVVLTAFAFVYNILICPTEGAVAKSDIKLNPSPIPGRIQGSFAGNLRKRSDAIIDKGDHDNTDYYQDYYYEQEEPDCPEDNFWHIRGRKCVPYHCPGGNLFRDKHTGECTLPRYGVSEVEKLRPSRLLNRMKTPSKFRLPFGLTLKG